MRRVCVLFSGGKDSTYSLHWAILKGFKVECLITIMPTAENSWLFHYPCLSVTRLQAESLGIPQLALRGKPGVRGEEESLEEAIKLAADSYGISGVVSGAVLSDYQRMRISMLAYKHGLESFTPLWRIDQEAYMRKLVEQGFEVMVISISAMGLPPRLLGRVLTRKEVELIIRLARRYGFNPAFEGGEAETLVVNAPLFRRRVSVRGRPVRLGEFEWVLRVERAWLE